MIIKKSKNNKTISFHGYKGADNYGTTQNREALKYKVSITPQKIDEIIKNAKTTDEGLVNVYKAMASESKNVDEAIRGIDVILRHYLSTAKNRFAEISQIRPYGAKIPYIGVIPDLISKKTGGFINRIQGYTDDLIEDFSKIVDDYFHSSINGMITKYREADNHLKGGIEYLNLIQGENNERAIIKNNLSVKRNALDNKYNQLEANLQSLNKTIFNIANKVIKQQSKNQNKRITVKALIKIISAGHD